MEIRQIIDEYSQITIKPKGVIAMKGIMPDHKEWRKKRYKIFNDKINYFKDHPKYEWLRKYADDAMNANEGFGYLMIKGSDFIERIEKIPLEYIRDWLNGKNKLEWTT